MKKFRLMKGLTCISALLAICFVFGCSSSSDGGKTSEGNYQTVTTNLTAAEDGTIVAEGEDSLVISTTDGDMTGTINGNASMTIPAGTKLYKADGTAASGNITITVTYYDGTSENETFFPGETYDNQTVENNVVDISPTGFAIYEMTDDDNNELTLSSAINLDIVFDEDSMMAKLLAPATAFAADLCNMYFTETITGKPDNIERMKTCQTNAVSEENGACALEYTAGVHLNFDTIMTTGTFAELCGGGVLTGSTGGSN